MSATARGRRWTLGSFQLFTADCTLPLGELLKFDVLDDTVRARWIEQSSARPELRPILEDACRAARMQTPPHFGESAERRIQRDLESAFKLGRLYLLRTRTGPMANLAAGQSAVQAPPAAKAPRPAPASEKTWIEIQLVDQNDHPVANQRYRLKITDNSYRDGTLPADGTVRVSGIDPGTCELTFLDLDGREWRPA